MAQIAAHLTGDELAERYRGAKDVTEARHFQAIWLLAQGRSTSEVASLLAFGQRWVEQLIVRYNAEGPAALGDLRRRNGRAASLLTPDCLAALAERIKSPPEDGGLWSGRKVAVWMAEYHGLAQVHVQRGWEALQALRWSRQVPRPKNPNAATAEEQDEYKKTFKPPLMRNVRRTRSSASRSGPQMNTASA